MSDSVLDVVIVGGGHAGLLLAGGLAAAGFTTRVLDPADRTAVVSARPDGRTLALLAGSQRIMAALGVWPAVEARAAPIWQCRVRDIAADAGVSYDAQAELGHPFGWGIENRELRIALLEAATAAGGSTILQQGRVVALERRPAGAVVELDDGSVLETGLVVAADGRGSPMRRLAGIGLRRWDYTQSALAFIVAHERPHGNAVRERLRPGGPLAVLPLPGRRIGVTWVEPHDRAAALRNGDPAALLEELARELGDWLGRLTLDSPIGVWPLSAQHAERYVAPRLALVGDAAHGSHPIHAQGFNMGVADVGALFERLVQARSRGLDLGGGDTLRPFERERRSANTQRLWLTDGLNRLFSNDSGMLVQLRSVGLRALDRASPLKRAAIRHGMQLA